MVLSLIGMAVDHRNSAVTGTLVAIFIVFAFLELANSITQFSRGSKSLVASLACTQLLAAPWLHFKVFDQGALSSLYNLNMMTSSSSYFSFMIPAVGLFCSGLFWTRHGVSEDSGMPSKQLARLTVAFGALVNIAHHLSFFREFTNSFLGSLFQDFLVCGLLMMHTTKLMEKKHGVFSWYLFFLILWLTFRASLTGMFGSLVFWIFLTIVATLRQRPVSLWKRLGFMSIGVFAIVVLQTAKSIYRDAAWGSGQSGLITLIQSIGKGTGQIGNVTEMEQMLLLFRVNQGWHVSHVMNRCEEDKILEGGMKTIESVAAAIVPRFFWPNKPMAGGQDNIYKYTSIKLTKGTSMNISFFGDFIVDFGRGGALICLGIFGLILGITLDQIILSTHRNVFVATTFPIIFVGLLQVETDLMMILNHGVKSSVLLYGISKFIYHKHLTYR